MKDRITTKDALVFIALFQRDAAGIYWMIWEAMMMMSGAMAFQYLLNSLEHPALGQDLTPSPTASRDAAPAIAA